MMKTINNALVTLLCAQVQLDLIQAAFEWDRKNPWVQRGEGGRFGKNNTNENLEGISTFTFLTEKLKDVKNDISSVIKNNNPLSLDMDDDKSSGDDLIEKLAEELKGEQKEDRLKTKYLKLLKEKAVPAGLTAAAFVALAALLVVTKNKKAASKMRNILSKEEVETFGIKTEELVEKVERGVVKEKPPNTSPPKSEVKPSQNPAPREESPVPRPEEKPVAVVKSENSLGLKIPDNFPSSREDLVEIKGLGGSTGAVLVMDKNTKKEFVLKKGANREHIKEEAIADEIYRKLGIKVPQSHLYENGDEVYKLSEHIPGVHYAKVAKDDYLENYYEISPESVGYDFRKGFVVDALLGNWDVAGLGLDNLIKSTKDGSLYRVDNGGSLRFRAQGGKKKFGNDVGELLSMRDEKINPSAAKIFSYINDAEVIRQIDALPTNMDEILSHVPVDLRSVLESRIKSLEKFKKDKITEWSQPNANLQKVINEDGSKYLYRSKSVDDSALLVKGVEKGTSLTEEEKRALKRYTDYGFIEMNNLLRNKTKQISKDAQKQYLELINLARVAISKLPRYEPSQPIVRFMKDDVVDKYKPGSIYIEPGFFSCSKYSGGVSGFNDMNRSLGVKVIIRPTEKSVAREISEFNVAGEAEVLYPPGMKFKVVSKNKEKFKNPKGDEFERWVVEVEEHE